MKTLNQLFDVYLLLCDIKVIRSIQLLLDKRILVKLMIK